MNTPGSVLTAKITANQSPLVYGYDEITHVFRTNGPIFGVEDHNRDWVSLQFGIKDFSTDDDDESNGSDEGDRPNKPELVISGGIVKGDRLINGEPALVSLPLGAGHIVLFRWNPMHRDVNRHDHAFLYNALLSWNDLSL